MVGSINETKSSEINIEKLNKGLKNTGNSVAAVGWLTLLGNIAIYLWSTLDKNYSDYGLPRGDLSGTFLLIIAAIVFVILGNRIARHEDRKIKLYLQILIVLFLATSVWVLSTGGFVGILFFLVLAYLISSFYKVNKAMRMEQYGSTLVDPHYKLNKRGWIISGIISLVLFLVSASYDISRQENGTQQPAPSSFVETSQPGTSSGQSQAELISSIVEQAKSEFTLPSQLDQNTALVDITAEPGAIRYHYILSGLDTSNLTNDQIKKNLTASVCQNPDTKSILDQGINMEYAYTDEETSKEFFTYLTRTDCV